MPTPPPGPFGPSLPVNVIDVFYNNMMICENGTLPTNPEYAAAPYTYFAVNLNASRGQIGSVLWWNTVQPPAGNETILPGGADPTANGGTGVFVEAYRETMQWVGYSMANGQKLWGPTPSQTALDFFGNTGVSYVQGCAAYGNLYSSGYGGILYCYNLTNGNLEWTYGNGGAGNSTNSGFNYAGGPYPTFITAIGNGLIYLVTTEHTATNPIYKGALTRCISATTGQEVWTLSDYTSELAAPFTSPVSYAIADGYATFYNGYDGNVYSVGQGLSATTVSAPDFGLPFGTPVVITGTVMDVSAGTQQVEQKADFPTGVPVSSDTIMNQWMGYVYQQQPSPTNFTGVLVNISVLDSNGNYYSIGNVTTTSAGTYSLAWTPQISGNYTVIASFAGTHAYWPSSAQAAFDVMPAPPSTPAPTATPTSVANLYFVPAIAGIFVLIIIVLALVVISMLRKRP
jgi:hypothetical protein